MSGGGSKSPVSDVEVKFNNKIIALPHVPVLLKPLFIKDRGKKLGIGAAPIPRAPRARNELLPLQRSPRLRGTRGGKGALS